ncbi:MAG: response regulator [Gammaproteobacteria bacterium]|nr:response regulator [Gammaproteobacteria bacterium]MCI0591517.1 response regulator [Gammaproteobacteria bacterium]
MSDKASVLIVDDDEGTRRSLALVFSNKGYEVATASSAREALDNARERKFNVTLVDVRLPDMEGVDLLAHFKNQSPDTALIMITGYASLESAVGAINKGASAYITKPLDLEQVLAKVKDAVEKQSLLAQNRRLYQAAQRELSEHKQAEEALRKSEERYRSLVEATRVIPWEMDLFSWQTTYIGPQAVATFGYSLDDWYQKDFWLNHVHPEDQALIVEYYKSELTLRQDHDVKYRMLTADGRTIWIRDFVSVVRSDETPIMLRGVMVNITEQTEKDAQLLHAQKMEAMGQLTGGIAHDFNNLLTIITGNLGLLKEEIGGDSDEETNKLIDDALSAARDGSQLTQRLLAFSRKQSLKPQRVNINEVVENFARLLSRTLGEAIDLNIKLGKDVSAAVVDPSQCETALLNLAINARDAMLEGGTLTIETSRITIGANAATEFSEIEPGKYVAITLSDNGVGIPKEMIAHVCEPFFTTKEPGKGSGLGLSMVYGFARQSGGGLRIISVKGEGTSVTIVLPESAVDVDAAIEADTSSALPRGTETILVAEDEARVRRLAVRSLQSLGYRVLEAENAPSAIKILLSEHSVNLLFSDILMPGGINGRELVSWAVEKRPRLKVVLTTGFSKGQGDVRGLYPDAFPVLKKPYSKEELAHLIRAALDT